MSRGLLKELLHAPCICAGKISVCWGMEEATWPRHVRCICVDLLLWADCEPILSSPVNREAIFEDSRDARPKARTRWPTLCLRPVSRSGTTHSIITHRQRPRWNLIWSHVLWQEEISSRLGISNPLSLWFIYAQVSSVSEQIMELPLRCIWTVTGICCVSFWRSGP